MAEAGPIDTLDGRTQPSTGWRIVYAFRPYRVQVALIALSIFLSSVVSLGNPLLLKLIIDDAILKRDVGKLTLYTAGMVMIPIVGGLIGVAQTYLNNLVGQGVMRDLRNRVYEHLQQMALRFFSNTRAGEIQSRLSNDVNGVQSFLTGTASGVVANLATIVSTTLALLLLSWQLTVISLVLLPVFVYVTHRVGIVRRDLSRITQGTMANISALVEETLSVSGVLLTKAFGRQKQETEKFETESQRLADLQLQKQMVGRWFFMMVSVFFSVTPAVVYFVGGRLILGTPPGHATPITIGGLVAFTSLQNRLFNPLQHLLSVQVDFASALALFDRIFEYLDLPAEIQDKPSSVALRPEHVRGHVAFEHVSFRYGSTDGPLALDDVSFEAEPGQLVALVGPSGSGKTTITYMVTRLYDATAGAVRIDGLDVRDIKLESLAEIMGIVTQETYLFNSTVRENLLFARPDATDDDLFAATKAAHIYDRILLFPDGFDTVVGERGYSLSGGERQRLAIARVLLKDPRILILDEATSALDTHSERLIQAALEPLMQGRTTIAIAHRLSTIMAADLILVDQGGRIVERGTHETLLQNDGEYAQLYHEQFAGGRIESRTAEGVVVPAG